MNLNTMDASLGLMKEYQFEQVFGSIARAASARSQQLTGDTITLGTVLYTLDGTILACDNNAEKLGEELSWNLR
jgi:hypothetical protein